MTDTGNKPNDTPVSGEGPPPDIRVTGEWQVSLVLSDEWAVPLPARFTYRVGDPYAVRLDLYLAMSDPVRWLFARELLITGALRASGLGDVRVWPTYDDMICVRLESRDGDALLEIPNAPLVQWLERTCRLVPPGLEHRHQPFAPEALLRQTQDGSPGDGHGSPQ